METEAFSTREVAPDDPMYHRLMESYFDELRVRFGGFEPPARDALVLDAESGCALVASDRHGPAACATLRSLDPKTGEVKRMFVSPRVRRRGVGPILLQALEAAARARGYERVVLDTHASLVEAARMYARAGYREIDRYNDNPYAARWFEKALV